MSLGVKVGIAVGAICSAIGITGFCIVFCAKRRRRKMIAERQRRAEQYTGPGFLRPRISLAPPPVDTKWEPKAESVYHASPVSANPFNNDKTFSPYSSKYNSPVSARAVAQGEFSWPLPSPGATHKAPQFVVTEQGYEMEKVAPQQPPPPLTVVDYAKLRKEMEMEAASKGFTVTPTLAFPPPPTRAKR
jgi:hypothetical protein